AIREEPDDDAPRLIYADWLEEHATSESDRVRAEYVRLECEHARIDADSGRGAYVRREQIQKRSHEIEEEYKEAGSAGLTGRKGPLRGRDCFLHFGRGFPDKAFAPADRLIAEGEALFRLAPITALDAEDVTGDNLGRLLECPWLARVRSLTLTSTEPSPD